jgi:hypothetical protein
MLKDKELEQVMQDLIVDICEIMYTRGYREVPIGALMRLIGVNAEMQQSMTTSCFNWMQNLNN